MLTLDALTVFATEMTLAPIAHTSPELSSPTPLHLVQTLQLK